MVNGRRKCTCEATWQVIKILFEGQARKADANLLKIKIFTTIYSELDFDRIIPLFKLNRKVKEQ
jgi:hypothetical protein